MFRINIIPLTIDIDYSMADILLGQYKLSIESRDRFGFNCTHQNSIIVVRIQLWNHTTFYSDNGRLHCTVFMTIFIQSFKTQLNTNLLPHVLLIEKYRSSRKKKTG